MCADELALGQTAIAAARSAGWSTWSIIRAAPPVEAMPHHWQKLRVEEQLFESGLSITILQPAAYMQNVLAYWEPSWGRPLCRALCGRDPAGHGGLET